MWVRKDTGDRRLRNKKLIFYLISWEKHQTFAKERGKLPDGWKLRLCDDSVDQKKGGLLKGHVVLAFYKPGGLESWVRFRLEGKGILGGKTKLRVAVLGPTRNKFRKPEDKVERWRNWVSQSLWTDGCHSRNLISMCTRAVVSFGTRWRSDSPGMKTIIFGFEIGKGPNLMSGLKWITHHSSQFIDG